MNRISGMTMHRAEKKIFRTPDTYGYFTATCTPIKPLSIALSGTYTGRMLVQRMDITAENAELGEMPERKAEAIRHLVSLIWE